MKKILISILVIFVLTNILCFYNTFAQENAIDAYSSSDSTTEGFSLTCFDFNTQETFTYTPSTVSMLSNSYVDTIEGSYSSEDLISPNYIIDEDTRELVDINSYPYKCIGYLEVLFEDGQWGEFSAFQAGKNNMILTAGHATYYEGHGKAVELYYYPGFDIQSLSNPSYKISRAFAPTIWTSSYDSNYDWAILFTENPISNSYLGIRKYNPYSDTIGKSAFISGYPQIKEGNVKSIGKQYCAGGKILDATEKELQHDIDVNKGDSGAPIYEIDGDRFFAIGINTRHVEEVRFGFIKTHKNFGVRFSDEFYDSIVDVMQKY